MSTHIQYLKLKLKGLPTSYLDTRWEESHIMSFARFQRFISNVAPKNLLLAYNDEGEVINRIIEDEIYEAKDMRLLDFSKYYSESFESYQGLPTAPLLYIYNVGLEQVNNYSIPDKKLFALVQNSLQRAGCVILASNVFSPTTFKRNYPITSEKIVIAQQILK